MTKPVGSGALRLEKTMKMITATIRDCVQIGPDDFRMKGYSRNFSTDRPISDVINWAQNMGIKNATINEITFFDYTGDST